MAQLHRTPMSSCNQNPLSACLQNERQCLTLLKKSRNWFWPFSSSLFLVHWAVWNIMPSPILFFCLLCVIAFPTLLWHSLLDPDINSSSAFDRNFDEFKSASWGGNLKRQVLNFSTWDPGTRHLENAQSCARGGSDLMWGSIFLSRMVKHCTGFLERWLMP